MAHMPDRGKGVRLSHASGTKVCLYFMEMSSVLNKELLVQVYKWRRNCSASIHSSKIGSSTWIQHSLLPGTWVSSVLADPDRAD